MEENCGGESKKLSGEVEVFTVKARRSLSPVFGAEESVRCRAGSCCGQSYT